MWSRYLAKNNMKEENDSPGSRRSLGFKSQVGSDSCKNTANTTLCRQSLEKKGVFFWGVATDAVALFFHFSVIMASADHQSDGGSSPVLHSPWRSLCTTHKGGGAGDTWDTPRCPWNIGSTVLLHQNIGFVLKKMVKHGGQTRWVPGSLM